MPSSLYAGGKTQIIAERIQEKERKAKASASFLKKRSKKLLASCRRRR